MLPPHAGSNSLRFVSWYLPLRVLEQESLKGPMSAPDSSFMLRHSCPRFLDAPPFTSGLRLLSCHRIFRQVTAAYLVVQRVYEFPPFWRTPLAMVLATIFFLLFLFVKAFWKWRRARSAVRLAGPISLFFPSRFLTAASRSFTRRSLFTGPFPAISNAQAGVQEFSSIFASAFSVGLQPTT